MSSTLFKYLDKYFRASIDFKYLVCYIKSMTGHELKARREALGLSQESLARELNVALSTIARWEQLKDEIVPNAGMLRLALEALGRDRVEKAAASSKQTTATSKKKGKK